MGAAVLPGSAPFGRGLISILRKGKSVIQNASLH